MGGASVPPFSNMRIVITSKKPVLTLTGRLPAGVPIEVKPQLAEFLIKRGEAVKAEVKEAQDRPIKAAGAPLSASPVAQASPEQTSNESKPGAKRGRRKKVEPS